ncbi:MAG: aldehyde dehydrogenase family protein, partial [Candidatus Rokuibacteriota bacterium]
MSAVANATGADATEAVASAEQAFERWAATPVPERSECLRRVAGLLRVPDTAARIARLVTRENGKPLAESSAEVATAARFFEWYAEEAWRAAGRTLAVDRADRRVLTLRRPVGVVAAITPWNFPLALVARKLAPALAAGCAVIVKPAEQTPLCAVALLELVVEAGVPPGVVGLLTTDRPAEVGGVLVESPQVRKLTFTGSTATGRTLMAAAAATLKRVSLELGGHSPVLVFADADLERAAPAVAAAKFRNAGQVCAAANRLYVQTPAAPDFAGRLADLARGLRVGPGLGSGTEIGPLIDARALEKVEAHVDD